MRALNASHHKTISLSLQPSLSFALIVSSHPPSPPPTLVMHSTEPHCKPINPLHWRTPPYILSLGHGICREAGKLEGERIRQQAIEEVEQLKQKVTHPVTASVQLSSMSAYYFMSPTTGSEHAVLITPVQMHKRHQVLHLYGCIQLMLLQDCDAVEDLSQTESICLQVHAVEY